MILAFVIAEGSSDSLSAVPELDRQAWKVFFEFGSGHWFANTLLAAEIASPVQILIGAELSSRGALDLVHKFSLAGVFAPAFIFAVVAALTLGRGLRLFLLRRIGPANPHTRNQGPMIARNPGDEYVMVSSKDFPINCDLAIFGNKIRIATLKGKLSGVIIDDENIAKTLKSLFELAWLGAKTLKK